MKITQKENEIKIDFEHYWLFVLELKEKGVRSCLDLFVCPGEARKEEYSIEFSIREMEQFIGALTTGVEQLKVMKNKIESELIHPADAMKMLDCSGHALRALNNRGFCDIVNGYRNINDQRADFWYKKEHVLRLKGLDTSALLGYKGIIEMKAEAAKWEDWTPENETTEETTYKVETK
jgi:hypothetical protein